MNRFLAGLAAVLIVAPAPAAEPIKLGVIGLDTSHAPEFVKLFNDPQAPPEIAGFRVVAAYPKGSPDIESSVRRVPQYTEDVKKLGVEIVDSIEELLKRVDGVLLETNDGRPRAEQVLPVLKAGKPVFIDKPVAGSLVDVVRIYDAAEHFKVPVFSSSQLRYAEGAQAIRGGKLGAILGADTFGPCPLEPTHPDLFWYGIHGVESLYTVMGPGCRTVVRVTAKDTDVVVGTWADGRVGTFRGTRTGRAVYGGTAFGEKATEPIGPASGYRPLVARIAEFFRTRQSPVEARETLEIYAFMEAADESKSRSGVAVPVAEILERATAAARENPLR